VGFALAIALIAHYGFGAVLSAFTAAGTGILWVSLFHLVPMAINTRAWQILVPGARTAPFGFMMRVNWIREGLNALVPLAGVAGDIVSIRLMLKRGMRSTPAVISLVLDMTLTIVIRYAWSIVGVALLLERTNAATASGRSLVALLAFLPILAALLVAQRVGLFGLIARMIHVLFSGRWPGLASRTARLDRALRHAYRRRTRVLRSCAWQLAGGVAGGCEIWLTLYILGHPVSFLDAMIIETMTQAIVSAAFMVPGALGVQEGGFLVIGSLLGIAPEISLALALVRRARDVILFVPALVAWQTAEGRHLFR